MRYGHRTSKIRTYQTKPAAIHSLNHIENRCVVFFLLSVLKQIIELNETPKLNFGFHDSFKRTRTENNSEKFINNKGQQIEERRIKERVTKNDDGFCLSIVGTLTIQIESRIAANSIENLVEKVWPAYWSQFISWKQSKLRRKRWM